LARSRRIYPRSARTDLLALDGYVRHRSFLGLRADKEAPEIVLDPRAALPT
jgi:hypothetical protein